MVNEKFEKRADVELSDGTVTLRPFRMDDAEAHLSGEDDEQVTWLSGGKSSLKSVQDWIERNQEQWQADGAVFNFAIETVESRRLVGMVEANTDSSSIEGLEEGDANVSYGLYPEARGKGYVNRAVSLLLDFLKAKGIKRAVIRVNPGNKDSLAVPVRLGFENIARITITNGEALEVFVRQLQ